MDLGWDRATGQLGDWQGVTTHRAGIVILVVGQWKVHRGLELGARAARWMVSSIYMVIHLAPGPAQAASPEVDAPGESPADEAPAQTSGQDVHPANDRCSHGGHHKAHTWSLIGARFSLVTVVGPAGSRADGGRLVSVHPGLTVSYELQVIPNWFEIELSAGVLAYPEGALFPIDLLFKKPFHAHHRVTPYVAVGPSLEVIVAASRDVFPGVGGRLGTYLWVTKHFGFDIEVGYSAVFEHGAVAHDIIGEVGPVVHF